MTITDDAPTWSSLLTPYDAAEVARYVSGAKRWLLKSGGSLAVREAELVGDMLVLVGREVVSGHACAVSVPASDLLAAA